jgi:hypothetical protein
MMSQAPAEGGLLKGFRLMPRSAYIGKDTFDLTATGELCPFGG